MLRARRGGRRLASRRTALCEYAQRGGAVVATAGGEALLGLDLPCALRRVSGSARWVRWCTDRFAYAAEGAGGGVLPEEVLG